MNKSTMWSMAAKYGLILSLISIVAELLKTSFTLPMWASAVLTIVKITAVIVLLRYFMKNYTAACEGPVTYGNAFKFGFILCLCSSIVCTAFSFIDYTFINPDVMEKTLDQMSTAMSSSSMAGIDFGQIEGMMPKLTFLSVFIDCMIFALIFPAILASFTKRDGTPFQNTDSEQE